LGAFGALAAAERGREEVGIEKGSFKGCSGAGAR